MITKVKLNIESDMIFNYTMHEYGNILLHDSINRDELLPLMKSIQTIITSGIMKEHYSVSSRYSDLRKFIDFTLDEEVKMSEDYKSFIDMLDVLQKNIAITQAGETGEKRVTNELNLLYPMPSRILRNITFSNENECEADIVFIDSYGYVWDIEVKNPKTDSMIIESDGEYHPKHRLNKSKYNRQYLIGSIDAQRYHLNKIMDEYYKKTGKILKLKTLLVCANPYVEIQSYNSSIEVCGIRNLRSRIIREHNNKSVLNEEDLDYLEQIIHQYHSPKKYLLKDYLDMDIATIIHTYSRFAARIKLTSELNIPNEESSHDEEKKDKNDANKDDANKDDGIWCKFVSFFAENQENIQTLEQLLSISATAIGLIKLFGGKSTTKKVRYR